MYWMDVIAKACENRLIKYEDVPEEDRPYFQYLLGSGDYGVVLKFDKEENNTFCCANPEQFLFS